MVPTCCGFCGLCPIKSTTKLGLRNMFDLILSKLFGSYLLITMQSAKRLILYNGFSSSLKKLPTFQCTRVFYFEMLPIIHFTLFLRYYVLVLIYDGLIFNFRPTLTNIFISMSKLKSSNKSA